MIVGDIVSYWLAIDLSAWLLRWWLKAQFMMSPGSSRRLVLQYPDAGLGQGALLLVLRLQMKSTVMHTPICYELRLHALVQDLLSQVMEA